MKKKFTLSLSKCYPLPVLFLVFVFALLSGCGTMKQVQVVERVQKDTLYLNHIQYDSIYVDNWQLTDRTKDTIYKVQIDTIPVIREVEVVKTEKYVPTIYKWSLGICIVLIILIVLSIAKKFFL